MGRGALVAIVDANPCNIVAIPIATVSNTTGRTVKERSEPPERRAMEQFVYKFLNHLFVRAGLGIGIYVGQEEPMQAAF